MADPKIRLKRSSVEGKIPTPDQVPLGEIALNTYDGYLYASKNVGIGTTVIAINPFRVGAGTNTYNAYFTAGNVGIGSEIPNRKLVVEGSGNTFLSVKAGTSDDVGIIFGDTDSDARGLIRYANNGDSLRFWAAGSEKVRITSAGDVGIGSEIPTTKLDVDGTVTATSFAGSGANLTGLTGASAATYGSTGATPVITVDANGRITGISTVTTSGSGGGLAQVSDDTSPQLGGDLDLNSSDITGTGNIDITGNLDITGVSTFSSSVGIGTRIDVIPYDTQNDGTLSFEGSAGQLFSITNQLSSGSIFSVNDISGIPSIDVDADGTIQLAPIGTSEKVGIGTTNPQYKLHVVGNTNIDGTFTVNGAAVSGGGISSIGISSAGTSIGNATTLNFIGTGNTFAVNGNTIDISIQGGGSSSPWITSGYTGIGTASAVGIGTIIEVIPYDTQNNGTLSFEGSAGQLFSITNQLSSGSIFSVNDISGIPSIDVDADGTIQLAPIGASEKVGIGTTLPTVKLDVVGDTKISGVVTATSLVKSGGTSSQFLKADGSVDSSTYLTSYTETDPVVAAINGIVKSDGTTISAATAGTDYLTDISQDTTPQLGGNLDLNSNTINGTGSINITGGASFTGNVTIGGTLTYEDVTNIDSVGLITARSGINATGVVTATSFVKSGGTSSQFLKADGSVDSSTYITSADGGDAATLGGISSTSFLRSDVADVKSSGNLKFADSVQLRFGTDNDLQIYHSGTASLISNTGTGNLRIRNTVDDGDVVIQSDDGSGGNADYFRADGSTGESILYHYGTQKLATKSNGIDVTGHTETDTLNVSGIATASAFAGFDYLQAPHGTTVNYAVTVAAKTAAHRYNGSGSSNGYLIDGVESPFLTFTPGRTYRFTLSSSDMTSHPFRFYLEADKTTAYTTNVTSTGTYTEIVVTDTTPTVLHYQCSAHGYMGNAVQVNSNKVNTPYLIEGLDGANITGVVTATSFVKSSNSGGFLKADGTEDTNTYLTSLGTAIVDGDFTSNGFMKRTGAGTYAVDSNTYLTTESDPVVAAINGIVKSDGTTISAATAGTDYLTPSGDGSSLTGLTGASAATYGSAGATPVIVVDSDGRITGISTVATTGSGGGGGISNVVEDTTPQLGGNLDLNSKNITGTGNVNISGTVTATSFVGNGSALTGVVTSFASKNVNAYTATAGQTTFAGTYTVGYVDVYLNGSKLSEDQYTASNGTSIVLDEGASLGDIVEVVGVKSAAPPLATRNTETLTIGSIASGVTTTGTITLPKTGVMISIHPVGDASGWLRLYTRSDLATADASRARTQDPNPGSGVILETITSGISTVYLSPQTIFASAEDTPINTFNYRFTKDGSAGITTFTFKYLSLEP